MQDESNQNQPKEYLDNQVHGGIVVNENVRAVFRAIQHGMTGELEVMCVLLSLPPDDLKKIQDSIDKIIRKTQIELQKLEQQRIRIKKAGLPQLRTANITKNKIRLLQEQSLCITQEVIRFLDSIGQWWMKKGNIVETGYLSLYDEEDDDDSDE